MFTSLGIAPSSSVPFPAWSADRVRAVEGAIRLAWQRLLAGGANTHLVCEATEPEITAALRTIIETVLDEESVPGFTPALFGSVPRGQEMEDYSGRYLEKRPDLTFQLLSARPRRSHNALFYECKILGRGRSLAAYVAEGIARFVDGRYAWCMTHAGMIGYILQDEPLTPYPALQKHWTGPSRQHAPHTISVDTTHTDLALTIHARSFSLPDGCKPGDISLRHLWLTHRP
jgi:hypothetical protein